MRIAIINRQLWTHPANRLPIPRVPGEGRDDERIVTGSDGSAWYTPDHYDNWESLR
jgi:hypothetical protein